MDESRWEIRANVGGRPRPGVDGGGWLWEIGRGDEVARVMIEIDAPAWSADPLRLPDDTRRALETDGRAELMKVLGHDRPPQLIRCDSSGCTHVWPQSRPDSIRPAGRAPGPA